MNENTLYKGDDLWIFDRDGAVYIETYKRGISLEKLHTILASHPEIDVTAFTIIKNAINAAPQAAERFGRLKERIVIELIENDLKALVTYNLTKEALDIKNRGNLIRETSAKLKENGIVYGIKNDFLRGELLPGKSYIVAQGIPPVNGNDAVVKMYALQDTKPLIAEDGKANFYELRLINKVAAGDWLGEMIPATGGTPGQSVKGAVLKAENGKSAYLNFDRNSVKEVIGGGQPTLYAMISGAVNYVDGRITVSNHLEVDGDVDFKTGNIKFDGYVTIRGTVADGFSVEATKDVEINGPLGLGNVKEIVSSCGSIFIRGGIASKGRSEIRAAKDIFTKFVDNAVITCGEAAHIGFYCFNSLVRAKEVVVESAGGLIVGGHVTADIKVTAPVIGSEMEKRTVIEVTGFNREALKAELGSAVAKLGELRAEQQKIKQVLARIDSVDKLNPFEKKEYDDLREKLYTIREESRMLEDKRKNIPGYLKARGEGEICALKKIYPNCLLIIKKLVKEITFPTPPLVLYLQEDEIKES